MPTEISVTGENGSTTLPGGAVVQTWVVNAGTGTIDPFLTIQDSGSEEGVNTDQRKILDNVDGGDRTEALQVQDLSIVEVEGKRYYVILVDLNEGNNGGSPAIDLNLFKVYLSSTPPLFSDLNGVGGVDGADVAQTLSSLTTVFDLDGVSDTTIHLSDASSNGSGWSDYRILLPVEMLGNDPSAYVTFHVGMSGTNGTFEEFATLSTPAITPPPVPPVAGLSILNSANGLDGSLDTVGEQVVYTATVTNTGNYALAGVDVTGSDGEDGVYVSGDADHDGLLDLDEAWVFSYTGSHALTQDELDAGGALSSTATATNTSDPSVSASALASEPIVQIAGLAVTNVGTVADGALDELLETVNYAVTVRNTGNYALGGIAVAGDHGEVASYTDGDTDEDGLLDVNEQWHFAYTGSNQLSQDQLDAGGAITSVATATNTTDPTVSAWDEASNAIVQIAGLSITNVGTVADGALDELLETVNYAVTVSNTGNFALAGVSVAGQNGEAAAYVSGDTDGDHLLDVTENWAFAYTGANQLSQAQLDAGGAIANTATVTNSSDSSVSASATASNDIVQRPGITIENYVSGDGIHWYDADTAGPVIGQNDHLQFAFVVHNTGNVTLTNVTLSDPRIDLNGSASGTSYVISSLAPDASAMHIVDGNWQSLAFSTTTTVTGTYSAGTTSDTDNLNYFGAFDGPGVRTPGFWSNNGLQFWNGKWGDETKSGANFATHELGVTATGAKGLLLGDWNGDGVTNAGENTFFVSLSVAQTLINASLKTQQDARYMLGRDVVASWLNHLSGNDLGDASDANSPHAQLQAAINWLEMSWDANHDNSLASGELNTGASAYRTSGTLWTGGSLSAATLHTNLDTYNNSGAIGSTQYSADGDDSGYFALLQSQMTVAAGLHSVSLF